MEPVAGAESSPECWVAPLTDEWDEGDADTTGDERSGCF